MKIKCIRCKKVITQRITKNGNKSVYCSDCAKETGMDIIDRRKIK